LVSEAAISSAKGTNTTLALVTASSLLGVWKDLSVCSQAPDDWHDKKQEELG